jgi:hypothetical protein
MLTAAAAVLAMIPLTRQIFWGPMAVAIMGGLIVATALTLLAQYFLARMKKTATVGPQPFEVKPVPSYVTCEECIRRHLAVDKRHEELAQDIKSDRQGLSEQLSGIRVALSENDKKAEERSRNLHKRIDPLVNAIAGAKANIESHLEDHRAQHPIGG